MKTNYDKDFSIELKAVQVWQNKKIPKSSWYDF